MTDSGDSGLDEKEVTVVKNATDLQRLKLEKLMKNPEKLAFIPDRPKDKRFSDPAEFVRNVMGSSAGAGSGEFHVYRHIRRREYARQEYLHNSKAKDVLDREYREKMMENKKEVDAKAAKKRAKRQRQKEKQRAKRQKLKEMKKKGIPVDKSSSSSEESSEDEDEKPMELQEEKSSKQETDSKVDAGNDHEMKEKNSKCMLKGDSDHTLPEKQSDQRTQDHDKSNSEKERQEQ